MQVSVYFKLLIPFCFRPGPLVLILVELLEVSSLYCMNFLRYIKSFHRFDMMDKLAHCICILQFDFFVFALSILLLKCGIEFAKIVQKHFI